MYSIWKRSLAMLLAIVMVIGNVPVSAFAEELVEEIEVIEEVSEEIVYEEEVYEEEVYEEEIYEEESEEFVEEEIVEEESVEEEPVEEEAVEDEELSFEAVTGEAAAEQAVAEQTESEITEIATYEQLVAFANAVNSGNTYEGKTVTLTDNIIIGEGWVSIGNGKRSSASYSGNAFKGTFDGQDNTISGLTAPLFGVVAGGTVQNVNLNANINTTGDSVAAGVAILVGGTVDDVDVSGSVIGDEAVGGVVGRMLALGSITNCDNTAYVQSTGTGDAAGGIVSKAYYTSQTGVMNITNCTNEGEIKSGYAAGGIAGFSAANISECTNTASVTGGSGTGGIVGEQTNYGTISDNTNSGAVNGYCAGGIVGWVRYQNSTSYPLTENIVVSGNENRGSITGSYSAGGIAGLIYNQAEVTDNNNSAASIGAEGCVFAGGIVGGLQAESNNVDIEGKKYVLNGNTSTTALEAITANCTSGLAYNNEIATPDNWEISGNTYPKSAGIYIDETQYETFDAAITAANGMTGDVTITINDVKVDYTASTPELNGAYDSISFVGEGKNAEISNTRNSTSGWIGNGSAAINFTDLILSKPNGEYVSDAAYLNMAFAVHRTGPVTYTKCSFPNGATSGSGATTFTECSFGTSHDDYGLWVYGGGEVAVEQSEFSGVAGVKVYANTSEVSVEDTKFTTTGNKPAVVLTTGAGIELAGNTYNDKGTLRLESSSEGIPVVSDVDPVCYTKDSTGTLVPCGVLVDGKIYTTVAKAVEAAEASEGNSTVTILYSTEEQATFPMGTTVTAAEGVDVPNITVTLPVATVGGVPFTTLAAAIATAKSGQTVFIEMDVTEALNEVKIPAGVTIEGNNHTVTTTGTTPYVLDCMFYSEGSCTVQNLTVAAKAVYNIGSTQAFDFRNGGTLENVTVNAPFASGVMVGNADVTVTGCTFGTKWGVNSDTGASGKATIRNNVFNGQRAAMLYCPAEFTGNTVKTEKGVSAANDNIVISDNTFTTGRAVSFTNACTFTGNVMTGEVYIESGAVVDVSGNYWGGNKPTAEQLKTEGSGKIECLSYYTDEAKEDIVITADAAIDNTYYATLEAAFAAAGDTDTVTLLENATPALKRQSAITKAAVIDLGGKTLTLNEADLYFGTTEFKNGTIVVAPNEVKDNGTAVFWMFENQTLTFNKVEIVATGFKGNYLIGTNGGTGSEIKLIESKITIANEETTALSAVICDNGNGNSVVIENSEINVSNIEGRAYLGGTNGTITVEDSTVTLNGVKEGFYIRAGQTLNIAGESTVAITLNENEGRYGINVTDLSAVYNKAETAQVDATVYEPVAVAAIENTKFESLQAAINAVKNGETITLVSKQDYGAVDIELSTDKKFTIDGQGATWAYNGDKADVILMTKGGESVNPGVEPILTIKNINFTTEKTELDFISASNNNYYPNLLIESCTFTGTGADSNVVAIRLQDSNCVTIRNCKADKVHSLLQNTAGWNLTIENVEVADAGRGMSLGTVQGVTLKQVKIEASDEKYGIRLDGGYNNNAVFEDCEISAYIPVSVRRATVDGNITFNGQNTMTAANKDNVWCAICKTEYEPGAELNEPDAKVKVALNGTGLDAEGVYGEFNPVVIGKKGYATLAAAAAEAMEDDEILLLDNITLTEAVELPAGVKLDLNNMKVDGTVVAMGDLNILTSGYIKTLKSTSGGDITLADGTSLELNNFSFGTKDNASAEYTITGGKITANYGFFQHGTYSLNSEFETGYMYYSYGSDITVYGTFHSHGKGDGLDYVRGKLTIANGGETIHDKALWVGQPASWGAMEASLVVEEGGSVTMATMPVYGGSSLESAGDITGTIKQEDGTITITGGTYSMDVSAWVDEGLEAVKNEDGKFEVLHKPVAKVGNTEYRSIDEAIANWTNNTTLTLLSDVTLSDVITIKSTEHHKLDLGTYTMTAAEGKNAIEIKACGTGSAEQYAITINADATNPGGINAGSKSVIYYKYADGGISTEDRPIIKINGGVFTGSNSGWGTAGIYTIGTAARKCATLNISGGTFNCSINGSGKSKLIISGGTFNYSVGSQGDSTALRLISGGTFNTFGFMTADSNNTKFWIGTSMGNSDVGVHVDDNGYIVVGGSVVTEAGENFQASSANYGGASNYLQYSSAKDNGLYYTDVEEAFADNNKASGEVTVYMDELDMTDISYKGTIVVPEGETLTVTYPEGTDITWTVNSNDDESTKLLYVDTVENGVVKRVYSEPVAKIGDTGYATLAAAAAEAKAGNEIVMFADTEFTDTVELPAGITLNGNGKTIDGTIKAGGDLTFAGETTVTGFNPGWYNNTITIGEGASLKVTGARITVSYGNTFNITGSVADAKTADKTTITPSLELVAGISFNGNGDGVNFNVNNAYVILGDSTTKNSGATGEFNLNFTNSIVDFTKTLKTYMPTADGLAPEFNFTAKNSVVSFTSHMELWLDATTMTLDNTDLTVGGSFANAGAVTVENDANFVVEAPIMSSHGGNTGSINVTGGAFELADSNEAWQNAGTMTVSGDGNLTICDFKNVGNGAVQLDATGKTMGDDVSAMLTFGAETEITYSDVIVTNAEDLVVNSEGRLAERELLQDENGAYQINNLADLKLFAKKVNAGDTFAGKTVVLTADIDLANEEWTPIGYMGASFKGNFDGGNHTIKNLKITKELTNTAANNGVGLFGRTDSPAVIQNLTIENVDITGSLYVGAVVGFGYTGNKVENVTVKGDIAIDAWWYAGVIGGNGYMNLVNNCHVIGNEGSYIKGNNGSYIGGIWGFRGEGNNKITNCSVIGLSITGVDRVGGISGIGHYGNSVEGCSAENVTIQATDPEATTVGLIVGATQGTEEEPTNFVDNAIAESVKATVGEGENAKEVTGLYGTTIGGTVPVTNFVAIVDGVEYTSLAAAVAAADNGDTVIVKHNNTVSETIVVDKNITLDLNGKKVTAAVDTVNLEINGELIITDSVGGGVSTFRNHWVKNGGKLTLEKGTLQNVETATGGFGVNIETNGVFVMNDGAVKAVNQSNYAISVKEGATAEINGGTINGNWGGINSTGDVYIKDATIEVTGNVGGHCVYTADGTVVIDGGTFIPYNNTDAWCYSIVSNGDNAVVAVNGGKFGTGMDGCIDAMSGTIELNDGSFTGNIIVEEEAELTIYGGTYDREVKAEYCGLGLIPADFGNGIYGVKSAVEAKIGNKGYATLAEAIQKAKKGDTILLQADVVINERLTIDKSITIADYETYTVKFLGENAVLNIQNGANVTLDRFTITGDSSHPAEALVYADNAGTVTFQNLVFDGIKGNAAIRTLNSDIVIDNCVFQNGEHTNTSGQGLVRLIGGDAIVRNSKFVDNTCKMALTFNYDVNEADDKLVLENNLFENNVCNDTAVVYYVHGSKATLTNNKFVNNTVKTTGNGATVYMGFTENNVITGNLFEANELISTGTSTRVSGGVFFGYETEFTGNAFIGNTATNANGSEGLGQSVCTSTYYEGTIDLGNNYWGGNAPVAGKDYSINLARDGKLEAEKYYTEYTPTADGNFELDGAKLVPNAVLNQSMYVSDSDDREAVKVEIDKARAESELTIKLYDEAENLLITSTLREADRDDSSIKLYPVNGSITLNVVLWGREAGSWDTVITEGVKLTVDNLPETIEVYADGLLVATKTNAFSSADWAMKYKAMDCIEKAAMITDAQGNVVEYYTSVQAAIDAAKNGDIVKILCEQTEDVTVTQVEGVSFTIDGNNNTFSGTIYLQGNARNEGKETLTIQNVKFTTEKAAHDFISCNNGGDNLIRYAHNVTVKDSSFNGPANLAEGEVNAVVGMRYRQCYNMTVENVTAENVCLLMWANGGNNISINDVTVVNATEGGVSLGTTDNVSVTNSDISASAYGVRVDADSNGTATVTGNTIEAFIPVIARKATNEGYSLTAKENDVTNTGSGYDVVVTKGSVNVTNVEQLVEPEVKIGLTTDEETVYDIAPFAKIGNTNYYDLAEAVEAVEAKETIVILRDQTLTQGVVIAADKTVTLDLNGYTVRMETADDKASSLILNNGNLTITDSSDAKSGKLSYNYTGTNGSDAYNTVETAPGSVLTVTGGTIENLSANCLIAYAIDGVTNGGIGDVMVNIQGGKITSMKQSVRIFANSTTKTGTLNISGGELVGRVIVQNANTSANKAVLDITGGTFNSNAYKTDVLYVGGSNGATIDMDAKVSGGTFNGDINSTIPTGFISGGTFVNEVENEHCAEGFEPVKNADGTYGVKKVVLTGSIRLYSAALNLLDMVSVTYRAIDDQIETNNEDVAERGVLLYDSKEALASKDPTLAVETVLFKWNEKEQRYVGETEGIDARDMGKSKFAIAYLKMVDGTYIFGTKNGAEQIVEYSPLIYCRNTKENPNTDTIVATLCDALMQYGAAAQTAQYGYTTGLMNEGFDAVPYNESVLGDSVFAANTAVTNGMKLYSVAMDLKGAVSYIIRFKVEDSSISQKQLYAEYKLRDRTGIVKLVPDTDNRWQATIEGIAAKDLDSALKVKSYYLDDNGEKVYGGELVYSGYEYVRRAQTNQSYTEADKALSRALAMYINSADIYAQKYS